MHSFKFRCLKFCSALLIGCLFSFSILARGFVPLETVAVTALPLPARQTLALIEHGGPFPYAKDGIVFGNYERLLPLQRRGYYREYTVAMPGRRSRGKQRIVTGGKPPYEYYYSNDHYASFRRIQE